MSDWHPQRIRAARAECRIRMAYCAVGIAVVLIAYHVARPPQVPDRIDRAQMNGESKFRAREVVKWPVTP